MKDVALARWRLRFSARWPVWLVLQEGRGSAPVLLVLCALSPLGIFEIGVCMSESNVVLVDAFMNWGSLHQKMSERTSSLFHDHDFSGGAELVHYLQIDPEGNAVKIASMHRFVIFVGCDFERSNHVSIDAEVIVGNGLVVHSFRVYAELEEAVGIFKEGSNELFLSRDEHSTLAEAIGGLENGLEELCGLPDFLAPFEVPDK
ncbi:hypothetical protein ACIPY6_40750 [Streptomyces sp. NPDC090054]|uniref:hypothetical protein n=1 Tax=Streptomyces sp. NPDC090054 TaxID=3365933 RepID=UPI003801D524